MNIKQGSAQQPVSVNVALDVRKNEEDKFWFRSDRFFLAEQKWYFTTREDKDVGPFVSRADAEHGLELFINSINEQQVSIDHAIAIATKGDWAVCLYH